MRLNGISIWRWAAAVADDGTMAGMLGRVRSQGHKGCQRIIRIKRGTVVLGVPFGAGSAHVMEFGPIGIEQASGQIVQRFAQIDHHRVGSRSSSLSHGPLPAPLFPGHCPAKLLKSGREWLVISVLWRVRSIARHACSARRFRPACLPTKAQEPPFGPMWLHEIKDDG